MGHEVLDRLVEALEHRARSGWSRPASRIGSRRPAALRSASAGVAFLTANRGGRHHRGTGEGATGGDRWAPNLGRRIPQLVAQTGLRVVAQDGRTSVRRGGDPVAHLLIKSFDHMVGPVAFAGARAELEAVLAGIDDPTFEFVDATNFGVSARHEPPPK